MKRIIFLVLSALTLEACQESMEQRAARDAREVTEKKCPMPIGDDGNVVLERIDFDIPTHTWKQDLLLNVPDDEELSDPMIKQLLVEELKNTPSYKPYRDNGFNFRYVYCRMSNPKDTLIDLTLSAEDYR